MRRTLIVSLSLLTFGGCAASRMDVNPSQNTNLNAVSPNSASEAKGGTMQRSLDSWLKEEWTPLSNTSAKGTTNTASDGTVVTTKTEATQVITTKTAPNGTVTTTTAPIIQESEDNTPFTLQKYADKWKTYHENKEKMNGGKPKEPSGVDKLNSLPVIGK